MTGLRRAVAAFAVAAFALPGTAAPATPPAPPAAAAPAAAAAAPLACDSLALSPEFARDRTAICLHVAEGAPSGVPDQPPPRRAVVSVTRDGGRTWRAARALGLQADTALCGGESPSICVGGTHALQAVFSANYRTDRTAYVALNDTGLWRTTDLGETFGLADRLAESACCSAYWLEPFARRGAQLDQPAAPLALTDGGSACSTSLSGTAEVQPPVHRLVPSPTTWPIRFLAPRDAAGATPVYLLGHACSGDHPNIVVKSSLYGCDDRLACAAVPLHGFDRRIDDIVAGGDHLARRTLYAHGDGALYRSATGSPWRRLTSFDRVRGPGWVDQLALTTVHDSATLYAWVLLDHRERLRGVLLRSRDGGASWTRVTTRFPWTAGARRPASGYYQPAQLTAAPDGRLFFLGVRGARDRTSDRDDIGRLWCSTDGGRTWATTCR